MAEAVSFIISGERAFYTNFSINISDFLTSLYISAFLFYYPVSYLGRRKLQFRAKNGFCNWGRVRFTQKLEHKDSRISYAPVYIRLPFLHARFLIVL